MSRSVRAQSSLSDADILQQMHTKKIKLHQLESMLAPDFERAVKLRRDFVKEYMREHDDPSKPQQFENLPYKGYDWGNVYGANCENVVGYMPIPVGIAGPILINGKEYPIPMATTEGALVASTHRGARSLNEAGGVRTIVLDDGMTRGPCLQMPDLQGADTLRQFIEVTHFKEVQAAFESTTRYGKLRSIRVAVVGRKVYIRFKCTTGDAMGMNMVTKGVNKVLDMLSERFPTMEVVSLSGNFCIDKKPSAMNWLEGRGKSVAAEARIPKGVVQTVLKTNAADMARLNVDKNLIGSALAGSVGGNNAHAANVVAAIFLATGQDPAQVVASSNCLTNMEDHNGDLYVSVTMPTIEVGTIGGGTSLPPQRSMLQIIGVDGAHKEVPGKNASDLAQMIAASVMAGEISLMAGLAAGHLTSAHMKLNRK